MASRYPRAAVAVTLLHRRRGVLLVRRSREPLKGAWSLPGGKIRLGEPVAEAARREMAEETGVRLLPSQTGSPFTATDAIHGEHHYLIAHVVAEASDEQAAEAKAGDDAQDLLWVLLDTPGGSGSGDCLAELASAEVLAVVARARTILDVQHERGALW